MDSHPLLNASFFSVVSPAKFGHLGVFYFCEVVFGSTQKRTSSHFWPLSGTSVAFKVIGVFPDARPDKYQSPFKGTVRTPFVPSGRGQRKTWQLAPFYDV